tara:strand:- start:2084 stop:2308 length:225 start_codon:yes stop_codon:yes gene_type:complete
MADNAHGNQKPYLMKGAKSTNTFEGPHGGNNQYHQLQYNSGVDNGVNGSFNVIKPIQGHTQQINVKVPAVRKKN